MISIPVAVGEVADKITILELKLRIIKDKKKTDNIEKELLLLKEIFDKCVESHNNSTQNRIRALQYNLSEINQQIWKIEDAIRFEEKKESFDVNFVQLARSIYRNNDRRANLKRQINLLTNSEIIEEKSYEEY